MGEESSKVWEWIGEALGAWGVTGLLGLMLWYFWRSFGGVVKRRPPGNPVWPVVGTLISGSKNFPGFDDEVDTVSLIALRELSLKHNSPVVYQQLGTVPFYVVNSIGLAKEILKTKGTEFADRPFLGLLKTFSKKMSFDNSILSFSGHSLLVRQIRKIFTSEMMGAERSNAAIEGGTKLLATTMEEIQELALKEQTVNMRQFLDSLTFANIARILFGTFYENECGKPNAVLLDLEKKILNWEELLVKPTIGDFFPYLKWLDLDGKAKIAMERYNDLRRFLCRIIDDHRSTGNAVERNNFVDQLLARKGDGKLPDINVSGIITEMIAAGKETSSAAIEWTLLELIRHPDQLTQLQNEIDTVVGNERCVSVLDVPNLPFMQAVVKESLRLHPPVAVAMRSNPAPATVGDFDIVQAATVAVSLRSVHREATAWGEDAEEFVPERFVKKNVSHTGTESQYLPFGAGSRSCVGRTFGFVYTQYILAALVHAFDWSPPAGKEPMDLSIREQFGFILRNTDPLIAQVKARSTVSLYTHL